MTESSVDIAPGILHEMPQDLHTALINQADVVERWNSLTPIQRNEWICWVTIVKKEETREAHIRRLLEDVGGGKRQPCCWPGCPHRRPQAQKYFSRKKDKATEA